MRGIFLNLQKRNRANFNLIIFFAVNLFSVCFFSGQTPISSPSPTNSPAPATLPPNVNLSSSSQINAPLSRDQAVQLALQQITDYNKTQLNESLAAEDIIQSKAALYPRVTANPSVIYTSPSLTGHNPNGVGRPPSFLGANAVSEYQALVSASGEIDISGKLRATIRRNRALLEAARSGTEAARRAVIENLDEAYLNLALAETKKMAARENLRIAEEFENLSNLLAQGGEVPPIDAIRANVQTVNRRDELSQAELAEQQAADAFRVFIGYDFSRPVSVTNLLTSVPDLSELGQLTSNADQTRPEIVQLNAEQRAALEDLKIARAERRPQLTYVLDGGFISDSLFPKPILNTLGVRATIGVTIPIFDFGLTKSRIRQAETKAKIAEQSRIFAERMLAQQYRAAFLQAQSARDRIRILGDSIINAEKVVEVSTLRYRSGEAPMTEVTDAQTQLVTQRANLYQAIYDYRIALARLRQAVGK